ncbi:MULTISPECIES: TRAP transporter large permease [Alphaproteobacteria]|uniref:TRAP transporter large permease n=1 Tax=Alphaproteobacteria TaxID=28211 RepID=UPI003A91D0FE
MSPELALSILLVSFVILFTVGVPLAVSLLFASVITIAVDPGLDIVVLPQKLFTGIDNFLLLAIPGFMFAALMMNRIGVTRDIVRLSDLLVGRIKGGLAHINVVSSMLMGGVSGSSTADVAGIGAILIPAMKEKGYSPGFSASLTAASSAIGSIIPPSILMVIYGASANVSIGALFIAGYIPGILVGLTQLVVAWYYAHKYGIDLPTTQKKPRAEKLEILAKGLIPVSVIGVIIGGIMTGVMTATESAAVASVYVVLVGMFVYRKMSIKILMDVAVETVMLTAVVMICVGTATLFGWLMSFYGILDIAGGLFETYASNPTMFLIFASVLFLLLGTFMDPAPAMLIFVPVLASVATTIGADPLQLGILVIMALAIGKITPPYGISLLLACTIAEIPLSKGLGWTLVFFGAFCALMLIIIFFPAITLGLPTLLAPELMGR